MINMFDIRRDSLSRCDIHLLNIGFLYVALCLTVVSEHALLVASLYFNIPIYVCTFPTGYSYTHGKVVMKMKIDPTDCEWVYEKVLPEHRYASIHPPSSTNPLPRAIYLLYDYNGVVKNGEYKGHYQTLIPMEHKQFELMNCADVCKQRVLTSALFPLYPTAPSIPEYLMPMLRLAGHHKLTTSRQEEQCIIVGSMNEFTVKNEAGESDTVTGRVAYIHGLFPSSHPMTAFSESERDDTVLCDGRKRIDGAEMVMIIGVIESDTTVKIPLTTITAIKPLDEGKGDGRVKFFHDRHDWKDMVSHLMEDLVLDINQMLKLSKAKIVHGKANFDDEMLRSNYFSQETLIWETGTTR